MKILTILVGLPKPLSYRGKEVLTGIIKQPVPGPVLLSKTNLEGDGQADLRVHGGPDKALYAYSYDAYEAWKRLRPKDSFEPGAFGENLSVSSLNESEICIGDVFRLGSSIIQVTQPRFPCSKLGIKFNDRSVVKQFLKMGRPGIYFRVLHEGLVSIHDELVALDREKIRLSVQEVFTLSSRPDRTRIQDILGIPSLNIEMREAYQAYLDTGKPL